MRRSRERLRYLPPDVNLAQLRAVLLDEHEWQVREGSCSRDAGKGLRLTDTGICRAPERRGGVRCPGKRS